MNLCSFGWCLLRPVRIAATEVSCPVKFSRGDFSRGDRRSIVERRLPSKLVAQTTDAGYGTSMCPIRFTRGVVACCFLRCFTTMRYIYLRFTYFLPDIPLIKSAVCCEINYNQSTKLVNVL